MRRMKRMMAMMILAAVATFGAQTAFAGTGIVMTDNANQATDEDSAVSSYDWTTIIMTDVVKGIIMTD